MHTSRLKLAVTLAVGLLFIVVLSAFAAPDIAKARYEVRLTNTNVYWFFEPPDGLNHAVCSYIPPGYKINPVRNRSNRTKTAVVQELPDGSKKIVVADIVTGKARDNYGGSYNFYYQNNITAVLNGNVVSILMKDEFRLTGPVNHTVRFKWSWQFKANNIRIKEIFANHQVVNLEVIPFFWPTDDGINPTTNPRVVRNSWRQHYTIGGGVLCDPI